MPVALTDKSSWGRRVAHTSDEFPNKDFFAADFCISASDSILRQTAILDNIQTNR